MAVRGCVIGGTRSGAEVVVHDGQSRQGRSRREPGAGGPHRRADPARIRNVVLVGPSGCGEDDAGRGPARHTGTIPRAGSVVEGTTVCDHDPAAVRQQRSVALSVAPRCCTDGTRRSTWSTPRLRRLRRRAARRAARRRRRAVRGARLRRPGGRDRPRDGHAVGGVRRRRACRAPSSSPAATTPAPTSRPPSPPARTLRLRRRAALPAAAGRLVASRASTACSARPRDGRGAPRRRRRRPQRAHRGHHRAVRGRDAHGALPRRRGDRHRHPDRRPRDRRRPRLVSPRHARSARPPASGSTRCSKCSSAASRRRWSTRCPR